MKLEIIINFENDNEAFIEDFSKLKAFLSNRDASMRLINDEPTLLPKFNTKDSPEGIFLIDKRDLPDDAYQYHTLFACVILRDGRTLIITDGSNPVDYDTDSPDSFEKDAKMVIDFFGDKCDSVSLVEGCLEEETCSSYNFYNLITIKNNNNEQ